MMPLAMAKSGENSSDQENLPEKILYVSILLNWDW